MARLTGDVRLEARLSQRGCLVAFSHVGCKASGTKSVTYGCEHLYGIKQRSSQVTRHHTALYNTQAMWVIYGAFGGFQYELEFILVLGKCIFYIIGLFLLA